MIVGAVHRCTQRMSITEHILTLNYMLASLFCLHLFRHHLALLSHTTDVPMKPSIAVVSALVTTFVAVGTIMVAASPDLVKRSVHL